MAGVTTGATTSGPRRCWATGPTLSRWRGDLRRLRAEADGKPRRIEQLLTEFPGIDPADATIFLREVQAVWPELAPYADARVADGAERLGLPRQVGALARTAGQDRGWAGSGRELARLAAALVRISASGSAGRDVLAAAGS